MLNLFRRFSRKQQLLMGFFLVVAAAGSVLAFLVDHTILIVALFWLLAALVFVVIMFVRRLNAKIVRLLGRSSVPPPNKKPGPPRNRLNSQDSLESLERQYTQRPSPDTGLPLARKLVQEVGDISGANRVLTEACAGASLTEDESAFVRRVESLKKYLDVDFALPQHHRTHNYVPKRAKIMYAVGASPVSISNGYTSRTQGIAGGLEGQGAEVIVTPLPGKPWDKKAQGGFRVPAEQRRYVQRHNGITYAHNPGIAAWHGDIDVFFQVSADAFVREAMIEKPEFILAASNYLSALPALIASRRLGIPFVYEMRGFWEVSAASVNPGWEESDQYRLDRKFELLVAQEADHVVVITSEMREDLISRGMDAGRISVAPNCVDVQMFAPLGRDTALLKRLGFRHPELPVVGFAGSVTEYEGLALLAEALAELKKKGKRFNFLVIGAGRYLAELQGLVTRLGLDECTRYASHIPAREMPVYLSSIDIFPLPRQSLPVTELVSPLKPLEAMAVGGAVVLSDVSPHQVFYGEDQDRALGFTKGSVAGLRDQLERLLDSPEERRSLGVRARQWVKENRQWSHAGTVLKGVFERVRPDVRAALEDGKELPLTSYRVAFIGDTFTSDTFLPELTAVRIRPDDWRERYAEQRIDALFIESAWQGNDRAWEGIVGYYDDETHAPLVELIEHSRRAGIPVLFWNKEDPVHFNRFKRTAALCDYVFTTDARTIVDYNGLPDNVIRTVASAPFAAQPLLHNPLPSTRGKDESIAYGGTYYGDKYATRKQGLDFLFYESVPHGLSIYERTHNDPNSPYRLPDRFKRYARPSLSYPDMCQAYKAHPIHLNGNSVVDSPSMFSRRVVEITASGSSVLSSAGRGVDETMAGTVPTVNTPDEANQVLQGWKSSEEKRHGDLWKALRHVYETHTCARRLTYMLRVAGLRVQAPQLPRFAVQCSSRDIEVFEAQTIRPDLYLTTDAPEAVTASAPIVHVDESQRVRQLRDRGIDHVIRARESVGTLGKHDVEDLVGALQFGAWKAVGKRGVRWGQDEPYVPLAALTTDINDQVVLYEVDAYDALLRGDGMVLADRDVFAWQVVKDQVPEDSAASDPAMVVGDSPKTTKTVLLAGHDFKFSTEISAAIQLAGHRILIDRWDGHDVHDEETSRRMLAEADVIFCEWALGNVRWYSQNKLPGQKLVVRLHAQELRTRFLSEANIDAVDTFIFVSPVGMRRAQVLFGIPERKCLVIGNTFDFGRFGTYRPDIDPKVLGLVGSVPQSKRLDLALDIIEGLSATDPEFRLVIKGKEFSEYPWLLARDAEKDFYERQYQRVSDSPLLQRSVVFGGHTADLASWYASEPGFILSTSDHEGTHQAIAEGGAAGCVPVIFPWAGAEFVYGEGWLVEGPDEAIARIRSLAADHDRFMSESFAARDYMQQRFTPQVIGRQILRVIEG